MIITVLKAEGLLKFFDNLSAHSIKFSIKLFLGKQIVVAKQCSLNTANAPYVPANNCYR